MQYAEVRTGLPEEILKLTERGAQFKRSAEEVENAMSKLTQAKLIQAQASTDYLAILAEGIAGLYICRDDRPSRQNSCFALSPRMVASAPWTPRRPSAVAT